MNPAIDASAWIAAEWDRCKPMLAKVLDDAGNPVDLDAVWQQIEAGDAQFWPGFQSAIVTRVEARGEYLACVLWLAGGEGLSSMQRREGEITAWAKSMGCNRMEIYGRKGWSRVLDGYSEGYVQLVKEI